MNLFIIILVLFIVLYVYFLSCITVQSKPVRKKEKLTEIKNNCFLTTGIWDGLKCNCKYGNFLTNNNYNGNCDKIVDENCLNFLDKNGDILDFSVQDPYLEGICNCKENYIYNTSLRQCVLQKIKDLNNLPKIKSCADGYYFSNAIGQCLKIFCAWDILNPNIRTDQKETKNINICNCDYLNGMIPVKINDKMIGCTKALVHSIPNRSNHCAMLTNNGIYHLYPQTSCKNRIKSYLSSRFDSVDTGNKMLAIREVVGNWLTELYQQNIMFYTIQLTSIQKHQTFIGYLESIIHDKPENNSISDFKPITLEQEYKESNDEVFGELRYKNNTILYSPLFVVNGLITLNKYGPFHSVYNRVLCLYFPDENIVVFKQINKND